MGMNRKTVKPDYGDRDPLTQGLGVVKDAGNVYKVIFAPKTEGAKPDVYDVPKSDPTGYYLDRVLTDEKAYIQLSPDEDQIWKLKPWEGSFYIRFSELGGPEDEPPTIWTRESRKLKKGGRIPEAECFTAVFRIVGDTPWRDMELARPYEFLFVPQPGTNLVDMEGHPTPRERLETLMEVVGDWDWDTDSLEWEEDPRLILAQLESVLQERNGLAKARVEDGWFKELTGHELEGTGVDPESEIFE